jgi:hypothetical protein
MALSSSSRTPRSARDRMDMPHNAASSGRVNARRPALVSSWGGLHRIFYAVLFLIVGFATMHVVFVGGQSGPLLPSSLRTSLRSEDPPVPRMRAKRAYTQLKEPTVTGSLKRTRKRPVVTHPLPPPRPKADLARLIARQTGQADSAPSRHAIALPSRSGAPAGSTVRR